MITLQPIGHVRTGPWRKFDAPSQPDSESQETHRIELLPNQNFELALQDLEGFDKIWLLSWFDRNTDWRPRVMPPRGPAKRRGVFATRSPHRPNPIGLTCVSLLNVAGLTLEVGPLDLLDGTPILDIKPYLKTVDCYPESCLGWLEPIERDQHLPEPYELAISPQAQVQLAWLRDNWGIDFTKRAFEILRRDPAPHRTRRILRVGENRFRMACGAWRVFYRIDGNLVVVEQIQKGYSDKTLASHLGDTMVDREAQIAFAAKWPH